ncbi:MAG TPA: hypothetical protein VNK04_16530 [Gemmataceae bacterium]|nr:hypothetical protein [Gemmataceae bacterium]
MKAIRFYTVIGEDRIIRPPQTIELTPGRVEVIVLQPEPVTKEAPPAAPSGWPLVERLAKAAQELGITDLPPDLAENHDHYLYGLPKGIDKQ